MRVPDIPHPRGRFEIGFLFLCGDVPRPGSGSERNEASEVFSGDGSTTRAAGAVAGKHRGLLDADWQQAPSVGDGAFLRRRTSFVALDPL